MAILTLTDIKKYKFIIPNYQRGYSWQKRQLEDFWKDVDCINIATNDQINKNHFFGTFYVENIDDDNKTYRLIDGQQRLTTLFIFLYILGDKNVNKNIEYEDGNSNKDFLSNVILGAKAQRNPNNSYQNNLKNAKIYLKKIKKNIDNNQIKTKLSKLTFNIVNIKNELSGINPQVIFETLNNRGKPLTILEKLKNRLMFLCSIKGIVEINEKDSVEYINEAWGKIFNKLGEIKPKYIDQNISVDDELISAHLTIYRRSESHTFSIKRAENKLFQMFCLDPTIYPLNENSNWDNLNDEVKQNVKKENKITPEKIKSYIESLKKFTAVWVTIQNFNKLEDKFLKNCLMLNSTKEIKIFLASILMNIDEKKQEQLLEKLEKVLFRENLPNEWHRTWNYETLAYYLNNPDDQIRYNRQDYNINFNSLHDDFDSIIKEEIDYDSISNGFRDYYIRQKGNSGFYKWNSLKYFLYKYDRSLENNNSKDYSYEELEIEHIFPQNPDENNNDIQIPQNNTLRDKIKRNVIINTLGNLTLLTKSRNLNSSNKQWNEKRQKYTEENSRSTNDVINISNNNNNQWNTNTIKIRGEKMYRFLFNLLHQYGEHTPEPEKYINKILYYDGNIRNNIFS